MTRADSLYLKRSIRAAIREAIWVVGCSHVQGPKRNILLFASRRGGSTWAMELIAANRGIRPLNQPLETLSRNVTYSQMLEIPRFHDGQITSLSGDEAAQVEHLIERIFAGEVIINGPTKFWTREFVRKSNRLVLKITDAKPAIDWFSESIDAEIVYLSRHPIPQALSCIRNDWSLTVDAHLRDPAFVDANLSAGAEALAHDVMAADDRLQRFVLNWALENVAPLRLLPSRPGWTHVRYEDCVAEPDVVLGRLSERLGLEDTDRMRAAIATPSGSSQRSTVSTVEAIESGRAVAALDAWKSKVDDADRRRVDSLLERVGIDMDLVTGGR